MRDVREVTTDAGIPVRETYTAADVASGLADRLGAPGEPPFTRGPYPSMYRGQLWTMRQFAGFGSPEEANERFRFLLDRGQTALSVAFDLPTQLGYDSGHPTAARRGRAGRRRDRHGRRHGGPVRRAAARRGLRQLHDQRDRRRSSWRCTWSRPSDRAWRPSDLAGTLQNDILKEFLARKTYVFPPEPSMRLSCDVIEFASRAPAAVQPDLDHRLPRARGRMRRDPGARRSRWRRRSRTRRR